ncbi:MAG: hypothetical protein J0M18_07480 [Ignavibacteria bacterium]|nr:hypothetical protein [Ignavibacteria bacterium]
MKKVFFLLCLSFTGNILFAQESFKYFQKDSDRKPDSLNIYSYPNPFGPSSNSYPPAYTIDVPENCLIRISLYHGDNFLRNIYEDYTIKGIYSIRLNLLEFFKFYENGTYTVKVDAYGKTVSTSFLLKR